MNHSDPIAMIAIQKSQEKLSAYTNELREISSSKLESQRKIDFLQNNLKTIEAELNGLAEKKNSVLKELNNSNATATLLDSREKELQQLIGELKESIIQQESRPQTSTTKLTRRSSFLKRMDAALPWSELIALIEPQYSKVKFVEDSNEISRMIRIYLLKDWFNLHPKTLEESLHDSLAMREFLGNLPASNQLPDQAAIEKFIKFLDADGLSKILQNKVQTVLRQKGLVVSIGKIVDASVTSSAQPQPQLQTEGIAVTQEPSRAAATVAAPKLQPNPTGSTASSNATASTGQSIAPHTTTNSKATLTPAPARSTGLVLRRNKLTFQDFLTTYGEPKKLITDIVTEFHALVVEKKETRHYLFNANIDNLIADQINFISYIFPKEKITHNNPIMQTAPPNMRIAIGTFDEIADILTNLLIDHFKIERNIAPTAAAHIIELVEETRCQIEDTNQTVWKPIELKASLMEHFFSMKGFICKSASSSEIVILGGLEFPLRILIDPNSRSLIVRAVCKANDWATLEDVAALKDKLNASVNSLNFDATLIEDKPVLTTQYYLPYAKGVPNRLLLKVCKSFALAIANGLKIDENDLMVKAAS